MACVVTAGFNVGTYNRDGWGATQTSVCSASGAVAISVGMAADTRVVKKSSATVSLNVATAGVASITAQVTATVSVSIGVIAPVANVIARETGGVFSSFGLSASPTLSMQASTAATVSLNASSSGLVFKQGLGAITISVLMTPTETVWGPGGDGIWNGTYTSSNPSWVDTSGDAGELWSVTGADAGEVWVDTVTD